jgi:ABC-2 type transport system permease protein
MSAVTHQLRATYAFVERNANLVKRYWTWEVVWLVYSIAESLSVSYIGVGMQYIGGGQNVDGRYLVLYLVVGTLVWRYLSMIFYWITDLIGIERWEGTIEYTLMAPIRRLTHMAGQTLFSVVYSLLFTAIILVVNVMLFDIDLANANLFGGALMLLAGSMSFIGVGIMASILPLLFPERGSQMTHVIIALPGALRALGRVSPAMYVLDGARQALLEGASVGALWPSIWPVLIMGVILIPGGLWIFRIAERYAKRSGRLHRNG